MKWKFIEDKKTIYLYEKDYDIERLFLWLRKKEWIKNIKEFENILSQDRKQKIKEFENQWLLYTNWYEVRLTNDWMNLYNTIITELIEEF